MEPISATKNIAEMKRLFWISCVTALLLGGCSKDLNQQTNEQLNDDKITIRLTSSKPALEGDDTRSYYSEDGDGNGSILGVLRARR